MRSGWKLLAVGLLSAGLGGCDDDDDGFASLATPYQVTNLVSAQAGIAPKINPGLVNPWGLAFDPVTGRFWIAANGTGRALVLDATGASVPATAPLEVMIDPPIGMSGPAAPTGVVENSTDAFVFSLNGAAAPATFLFATDGGTINAWSASVSPTTARVVIDNSLSQAVYKGLAIGVKDDRPCLFVADFRGGKIDVFDGAFEYLRSFADPTPVAEFAPFNVAVIDAELYVAFAKQRLPDRLDDEPGPGNGFVEVFDLDGRFLRRLAAPVPNQGTPSAGPLNSPWAMVRAPARFGSFSGMLLVGNVGDGRINAFTSDTNTFIGQLVDASGAPVTINGLRGLAFGPMDAEGAGALFFDAGAFSSASASGIGTVAVANEANGIFGTITLAP